MHHCRSSIDANGRCDDISNVTEWVGWDLDYFFFIVSTTGDLCKYSKNEQDISMILLLDKKV